MVQLADAAIVRAATERPIAIQRERDIIKKQAEVIAEASGTRALHLRPMPTVDDDTELRTTILVVASRHLLTASPFRPRHNK
jgi:hypothetical protein